jgi:hypothetical protein
VFGEATSDAAHARQLPVLSNSNLLVWQQQGAEVAHVMLVDAARLIQAIQLINRNTWSTGTTTSKQTSS